MPTHAQLKALQRELAELFVEDRETLIGVVMQTGVAHAAGTGRF